MSNLTEHKSAFHHYYSDDKGWQGEFKAWFENGKLDEQCFYKDSLREGEYKDWWSNGQLTTHCFYKDDNYHGEYKSWIDEDRVAEYYSTKRTIGDEKLWDDNAAAISHYFYQDGNDITIEVEALVVDIKNITNKERMLIKLKFGIECLK